MKALISVSDKTGVVEFAGALVELGWEILSTSGTMKLLREAGLPVTSVSDVTGFPEICDGRVKTLHPKIHGALLARRDIPEHMKALKDNEIETIDLVCVNLYPFRETIAKPDVTMEDAVEHIDIGGPSMLRSAAKNWESVTVVCNPSDYSTIISEIKTTGNTTRETRLALSAKAYTHTAEYDMAIATYMRAQAGLNEKLFLEYDLKQSLRYGENPHQQAKFYSSAEAEPFSLATAEQLGGKELSYNNIQDANATLNIAREFDEPFCVGVKHMNPCGSAVGKTIAEAWRKAYEADKTSIFGGIVAANREIDLETAQMLKPIFLEIVMAPSFAPDALELLQTKKNLRILKVDMTRDDKVRSQYVSMNGGMLVQDRDSSIVPVSAGQCVTEAKPTEAQLADLDFAWKIVKHVKSNAIVVAKDGMTYGVGAGQMNRVGSAEIALKQAAATLKEEGRDINAEGLVLASDGFFPFNDVVALAAEYGIRAIVQPGGSIRDEDSVKLANEKGITMLFTGERHFKH
ncbi:MAG: bifunctional phosphoribosylaminoimidazolecarboxamide formyltransferase/IMP cyclohydrolase [Candidatus Cryptobacteroides sp.]|nr:bifunctional phosphoribosylaminoimidazolecarboxamide formyltransferase/IMP cyclohydrolase [Bacteroidales bacterium]MDD7153622.1 bifunctional phosphoribosylaminoimidazolecarboxamide formyltransferase/IMP cyclohydrolase [Bacteroidales bacterium]MDY5496283.1 bifunctional phosphoribosylaminoimidazolecarboxamide formyltransferase/IMP cyclohydrolase [Candidatus Cryptobacteroides sp.]